MSCAGISKKLGSILPEHGLMNDTLRYMAASSTSAASSQSDHVLVFIYAFSEHFILPPSHDRSRARQTFVARQDAWREWLLRTGRLLLAISWRIPQEAQLPWQRKFGQWHEWRDYEEVKPTHQLSHMVDYFRMLLYCS